MADWLPIETAPKDGTVVLLNGDHPAYPMRGYWDRDEWAAENMTYVLGPGVSIPDPTHWTAQAR